MFLSIMDGVLNIASCEGYTKMIYPNLFISRYPRLKGKAWLNSIMPEDKAAFIRLGQQYHEYGKLGGKIRAKTGKRDSKGRFIK
jgi:hypothetical protein